MNFNKKNIWYYILGLFLLLRAISFLGAYLGFRFLEFKYSFPYADPVLMRYGHPLFWSWANFDGVHYIRLAEEGYAFGLTQAFFPLYFLLIKVFDFIFRNKLLTGLIISHGFFIASLWMFYKLVKIDYSSKIAKKSMLYLALFPTSFYFLSVYTESLFLFLLLSCFYLIRTKRWFWAGLIGIPLTLTRIVGIFIIPAFLYEIYLEVKDKKYFIFGQIKKGWKYFLGLLPALGLISYMVYLQQKFQDPLLFAHVQSGFKAGRETDKLVMFYQVFWRYLKMIVTVDKNNPVYLTLWFEFLSTISFVGLIIWGYLKKVRLSYVIFSAGALVLPTLTGTLSSMPRYVLVAFPAFMVLAMIKNKYLEKIILAIFAILLIISTAMFTRGYWLA